MGWLNGFTREEKEEIRHIARQEAAGYEAALMREKMYWTPGPWVNESWVMSAINTSLSRHTDAYHGPVPDDGTSELIRALANEVLEQAKEIATLKTQVDTVLKMVRKGK